MKNNEVLRDHNRLLENMKLLQRIHTAKRLSECLGITERCWSNRMKAPWRYFSYDDLKTVAKYCNVDLMQIIDGTLKIQ